MFGLSVQQVIAAIGVLFFTGWGLYENRGLLAYLKWPASDKAKPDRKKILSLLDDAYGYFDEANCPEGMAAIKTAMQHVFTELPHP